jgi:hypothetical protein
VYVESVHYTSGDIFHDSIHCIRTFLHSGYFIRAHPLAKLFSIPRSFFKYFHGTETASIIGECTGVGKIALSRGSIGTGI